MILNFILWFICELIEIFAIVKIYKKVESKVKSRFYFICLCIFTVIIAPLASLINLLLYYIILMVQPFLFYAYFYKKEKLPNYLSLFLSFFLFVVKNSRKQRKLDLEEIYEPEFSTKGCRRGLGLNNLKEILENYEYIMLDTEISKYDFTQVLTIKRRNSL